MKKVSIKIKTDGVNVKTNDIDIAAIVLDKVKEKVVNNGILSGLVRLSNILPNDAPMKPEKNVEEKKEEIKSKVIKQRKRRSKRSYKGWTRAEDEILVTYLNEKTPKWIVSNTTIGDNHNKNAVATRMYLIKSRKFDKLGRKNRVKSLLEKYGK